MGGHSYLVIPFPLSAGQMSSYGLPFPASGTDDGGTPGDSGWNHDSGGLRQWRTN